jgi:type I restriction enzyme S subunit
MEKYPKFKHSKFDWLGEIPEHWILTKNRYGFRKSNNGSNDNDFTPVLSLTTKGVKVKKNLDFGKSSESYIGHQLVEIGDIVFTPRDFDQTPILSDVSKFYGCISNLYIVDKTKDNVSNNYVNYYWYGLKFSVNYFKNFSHGMRFSFNRFQFDEIPLLIPPLNEQLQIVNFLDEKTELIDELISIKERKITLLKEQRTSLINDVVTKGLNPNVKMKDSRVEWIGEIPEGWLVTRIGFISELLTGNPWKSDLFDFEEGLKIVRGENVSEGFLRWGDRTRYWKNEVVKGDTYFLKEGDVVISMDGSKVGKNYVLINQNDLPLLLHQRMCRVRCKDVCSPIFLNYFVGSQMFRYYIDITKTDPMIPHITQKDISNFILPLPSIKEQLQIVEHLDNKTKEIDNLVQLEQKKIDLLKEYRQSLISEVVTGKIKVTTDE